MRPDDSNPLKHIRKYPEEKRVRVLSAADLSRVGEVLLNMEFEGVELLKVAERIENKPWVITDTLEGKRLSDLQPFWQRVRAQVGLKNARIHDLRHTSLEPQWPPVRNYP